MDARALIVIACLACLSTANYAVAQDWPQRPVKIVVPFGAGGNADVVARIITPPLGTAYGQPFVVENRPGAAGALGTEFVARAAPDGYTLLLASQPQLAIVPAMTRTAYDPEKDFIPISNVGATPFVLVVQPRLPVKTLAEFLDYVRGHPKQLSYAATGFGAVNHLTMALLLKRAGADMNAVFYKGGPGALTDVIGGHVDAYLAGVSVVVSHAQSGALRPLAVTSEHRLPQLPNVPTFAESGFPGLKRLLWSGLLARAGTPREIVDRLAQETRRIVRQPDIAERLANAGVDPVGSTPEELAATIAADIVFWREAVSLVGVQEK